MPDLAPSRKRRIRARRLQRTIGALVLLGPVVWVLGTDLLRRWSLIRGFDRRHTKFYLGSAVEAAVFWACLLYATSRRRPTIVRHVATALFVVLFAVSAGV